MAKKTSKLQVKVKGPDLVQYQIWWIHHGDLKTLGDIPSTEQDKMPLYVHDEIHDLLWEDAYKRTSLSIPDALGINQLVLTEVDQLAPARRKASKAYQFFVGILVYHKDVTEFMHNNGIVTNYLGEPEKHPKQGKAPWNKGVTKLATKTLEQRLEQFDRDVRALTDPEGFVDEQPSESTGKPLGKRVADLEKSVKQLTAEPRRPIDLSQYHIWWMDYDTLEGFGTWPPNKLLKDGKLPPYIYNEVYSLLDNDRYLETGLTISPTLPVTADDWKQYDQVIGQNMLRHGLVQLVGILVRKQDVTEFMQGIGRFTDHMAVPLVTGKEKHFNVRDYAIWWLTYGELELLADEVNGTSTVDETYIPGLTKFGTNSYHYLQDAIVAQIDKHSHDAGEIMVPHALGFTIEDWDREAGYINVMNPTLQGRYGIVFKRAHMLPLMEEMGLVTDHTYCRMTDPAGKLHARLVKAAEEEPKKPLMSSKDLGKLLQDLTTLRTAEKDAKEIKGELLTLQQKLAAARKVQVGDLSDYALWWLNIDELSTIVNALKSEVDDTELNSPLDQFLNHIPIYLQDVLIDVGYDSRSVLNGGITIPATLPVSFGDLVENGSFVDTEQRGLDTRHGFLFPRTDWMDYMDQVGIVTDDKGRKLFRPNSTWENKKRDERTAEMVAAGGKNPFVDPPSDDIERDCCDAKETYCIWWLGQDENKRINEEIRKGKVKLPGYIADELRRYEDCITNGKVAIYPTFPHEVSEIIEESDSEDCIDVNGIVIMNVDAYGVEKLGGCLTTLDMKSFAVETHLAEELAIHNKPYTDDEIRELFLQHIRGLIEYWGQIHPLDGKQAASGIAHSICVAIAGNSMNLPGFRLVPMGTEEDNEYRAENGERPWPVVPPEIADTLPDGGAYLHEMLYHPPEKPVAQCEFWLTKDQWRQGMRANKWAWCFEVLLKDTQFIKDRYVTEHPGTVLGNAYRELCRICLKHGAYFVPDEWDVLDSDYSFKWVTDDPDVFEAMLNEMSGYTLRGHF